MRTERADMRRNLGDDFGLTWEGASVSYVGPNSFSLAGIDLTGRYLPGVIVRVPGSRALASVLWSSFSTNTTVYLSDAVCSSGMSGVQYAAQARPFVALTPASANATYTQSGFPASYIYDGSVYSNWSDGTNASSGTALGLVFSSAKKVRALRISQFPTRGVTGVNVQYYNGSSWVTHVSLTLHPSIMATETLYFDPPASGYTQWQIVSTTAPYFATWAVLELSMSE